MNKCFITTIISIFLVSFLFRVIISLNFRCNYIESDGITYHNIAVNLVRGNGYSEATNTPYERYLLREPGYPIFLALTYNIYRFFGNNINYVYRNYSNIYSNVNDEIIFAKIVQAFIDSLSICLFFIMLIDLINFKVVIIICSLLSVFFPSAYYTSYLFRETLLTFITLLMTFYFYRYLIKKKILYLILSAFFWGISCLVFQAMVLIPFLIFLILLVTNKLKNTILLAGLYFFIGMLIISPWLIYSYNYYPNIKIFKSMGCSLTHEMNRHTFEVERLVYYGYISKADMESSDNPAINYNKKFTLSAKEQFDKSFNGYFIRLSDSLNRLIPKETLIQKMKRFYSNNSIYFNKAFFFTHDYSPDISKREVLNSHNYLYLFILILIPIFIGLLSFIGLYMFFTKLYPLLLSYIYFYLLFFILGSETRRLLPGRPFLIMLSVLAFYYLFYRIVHKCSHNDSIKCIISK
jgi:hypothetical protein